MNETALQRYFKEKLQQNESHVLVVYEQASPFHAPIIMKSVSELESNHPEQYRLVFKGIHASIVLTQ